MNLRRGDVVTVVYSGDYGKVRPAVIVQADSVTAEVDSVIVSLFTSTLRDAPLLRLTIEPTPENGLRERSQLMIDKTGAVAKGVVRGVMGRLTDEQMSELGRMLAFVLGIQLG